VRWEDELSAVEAKTGQPASGFGRRGRRMECVKEDGVWRVWREGDAFDDLAAALAAAKTEGERSALLAADEDLVTADLARAINARGNRLSAQGKFPEAMAGYQLALGIAERLGDRQVQALILASLGRGHLLQGNFAQGLDYYQRALPQIEVSGNQNQLIGALVNLGVANNELGNYEAALAYYLKSLPLIEASGNKPGLALIHLNLGSTYYAQDNYARAWEHSRESVSLAEEVGDKDTLAQALNNIGNIHHSQGNYAQALESYRKCLALAEELGTKDILSRTLTNVGATHMVRGDYAPALENYQKSLAIREALGDKVGMASLLTDLGVLYARQKNYAPALEYYQKALAVAESAGDKASVAALLGNFSNIHYAQGDYGRALDSAGRAVALARQIGRPNYLWPAQRYAGRAYRAMGRPAEARQELADAVATVEAMRLQTAGAEQERQRFFEERIYPYYDLVELLVAQDQVGEAFTYCERAKARVLLDVLQSGRVKVTKAVTASEQERERDLTTRLGALNSRLAREQQAAAADASRLAELRSEVQRARLDYESFQTALYAAHPELRTRRGDSRPIGVAEAASLLPDAGAALLEFIVGEERTFLFVLTRAGAEKVEVKVFPLQIRQEELRDRVTRFRERLAARDLSFRAPGRELYDLLLGPARAELRGKTSLVIVPDGALWELPFQALQPAPSRSLLEDQAILYAPSLTVLREMRKLPQRSADAPTLLAFGNPELGGQPRPRAGLVLLDEPLAPVPELEHQVQALRRIYGAARSKVYLGAAAREESFKAEAANYRILHLATHGILNNADPMYSHLLLAQGGAQGREDGLLEAWEIMKLDLRADLAVLSACETARGRVGAGEGVIGLSWALFVAGCPTTVVSQWKVGAAGTTELMLEFHRRLQAKSAPGPLAKAQALREAALSLTRHPRYRHPFHWAGFVMIGDGY